MAEREKTVHNLEKLGVAFALYTRPTVREQLQYWSRVREYFRREDLFERYWEGAKALVMDWSCEYMPLDVDLDAADDPRVVDVIQAVGMLVYEHIKALDYTPKN